MDRASKEDPKAKIKAWKAANRLAARQLLPLPDAQMEQFFDSLGSRLEHQACQHDHGLSEGVLLGMGLDPDRVDAVLDWCADNSGYCDCEVILNAEGRWRECRALP